MTVQVEGEAGSIPRAGVTKEGVFEDNVLQKLIADILVELITGIIAGLNLVWLYRCQSRAAL